jgi:glycosidase
VPYIKELGVSAVWLSPIYPSPGKDFGYDISDYLSIDPTFGTMDDFDQLVTKLHEAGRSNCNSLKISNLFWAQMYLLFLQE